MTISNYVDDIIIFLIYINDNGRISDVSNIKLYALHKLNYMPINDDIVNIFMTEFDCDDADDFFEWYIQYDEDIERICGLLGRYLYYNKNNPPRRL